MRRQLSIAIASAWMAAACAFPAFAGLPDPPFAEQRWELIPSSPTTRDSITLRNIHSGCSGHGTGARELMFHPDGTIDFYMGDTDDTCGSYVYDSIIDTHLGYLRAGDYIVRFIGCGIPYDPEAPDCTPSPRPPISFSVAEAGLPRRTIPATSLSSSLALAAMLALAGTWLMRQRR